MARYTGPDCKRCRREKMKLFLKGAKCESPKCPIEIRPYPPGRARPRRTKDSEYLLQLREKQKAARIYGVLEKQFRGYYEEATAPAGQDRREPAAASSSPASTTWSTAPASPSRGTWPASWCATATSWSTAEGRHPVVPGLARTTSSRSRQQSRELTPFVVARAEAGERTVPAWLEVDPRRGCAILVHALPARAVIDTQVQEQLIVELYSK